MRRTELKNRTVLFVADTRRGGGCPIHPLFYCLPARRDRTNTGEHHSQPYRLSGRAPGPARQRWPSPSFGMSGEGAISFDTKGGRDRRCARNARYRASSSHAIRCAGVAARAASSRASRLPSQVPYRHGSALLRWSFIAMGSSSAWREYAPDGPRRPDPGGGPRHASWRSDRRSTQREPRYRSGR